MTLKEKVERALKYGEEQLIASGSLMALFHAESADGKLFIIATPWPNDEEKVKTLNILRCMFVAESIVNYVLLSEIWVKSCDGDEEYENYKKTGKMPCEYDDKDEALFGLGVNLAGEICAETKLIKRDAAGKITHLVPYKKEDDTTKMTGRMTELLHPLGKEMPQYVRDSLKVLWKHMSREI